MTTDERIQHNLASLSGRSFSGDRIACALHAKPILASARKLPRPDPATFERLNQALLESDLLVRSYAITLFKRFPADAHPFVENIAAQLLLPNPALLQATLELLADFPPDLLPLNPLVHAVRNRDASASSRLLAFRLLHRRAGSAWKALKLLRTSP